MFCYRFRVIVTSLCEEDWEDEVEAPLIRASDVEALTMIGNSERIVKFERMESVSNSRRKEWEPKNEL